jgi:biotin transporter BioY
MNYMLAFLLVCAVIGLWAPAHTKRGRLIFALAAALVIFFFIYPDKL